MFTRAKLISEFFPLMADETRLSQIKPLSDLDKSQLASAIARQRGLTEAECDFTFVAY